MTTHHTQPLPVKLRVEGFPTDIAAFVEALRRAPGVRLLDCSRPYHNRRGNPALAPPPPPAVE